MPTLTQKKLYNHIYDGAQQYSYEAAAARPREQRETRGELMAQTLLSEANIISLDAAS